MPVIHPLDPGHDRDPQLIPRGRPATDEHVLLQQSEKSSPRPRCHQRHRPCPSTPPDLDGPEVWQVSSTGVDSAGRINPNSDRGIKYRAVRYTQALEDAGALASVGSNRPDSEVVESFLSALKNKCVYRTGYDVKRRALRDVIARIEGFYNSRLRSALVNHRPNDVHYNYRQSIFAT